MPLNFFWKIKIQIDWNTWRENYTKAFRDNNACGWLSLMSATKYPKKPFLKFAASQKDQIKLGLQRPVYGNVIAWSLH